jgi:hypothetical protein
LAEFADGIEHPDLWCPAAGLELVVIGRGAARKIPSQADFLLEVNTGREIRHLVNFDPAGRPAFWYLLDRDVARQSGEALFGPPAAMVLSSAPRQATLAAIAESLEYQSAHPGESLADSAILNACRSLRFVRENRWYSKPAAGRWAMTVPDVDTRVVARALEAHRQGRNQARSIAPDATRGFIDSVRSLMGRDATTGATGATPGWRGPNTTRGEVRGQTTTPRR